MYIENSYESGPYLVDLSNNKKCFLDVKSRYQRRLGQSYFFIIMLFAIPMPAAFAETYDQCLLRHAKMSDGSMTLNQIRENCEAMTSVSPETAETQTKKDLLAERFRVEQATRDNPFVISPHKQNYVLPLSYSSGFDYDHFSSGDQAYLDDFSRTEIKFQLSMKAPVIYGVFDGHGDLYVAYTNTSWWQAYNSNSAPFRETNHEPEAFLVFQTHYDVMGMNLRAITTGITHQSNGRSGALSRSWNRIYANFIFEQDNFYMSFKPWWRIPEKKKAYEGDPKGDDNPDIDQYMGYGELRLGYKMGEYNLGMMLRNNLRSENKGAAQLDWSFPINNRFRGYVQYFNGYGESLIDYNDSVSRFSIGIMLTDWL